MEPQTQSLRKQTHEVQMLPQMTKALWQKP